jgi:hypothetical protein
MYTHRLGILGFPAGIALLVVALLDRNDLFRSSMFMLAGLFVLYLSLFIMVRGRRPERT